MQIDVRGKTVALTGTFAAVKRAVAEAGLVARGAIMSGSVGKKTDLVFAGADAGSKLEKARALGVPVHDEAALLAVITGQEQITPSADHPFHAGFDRLVAELEAHPRVHVVCAARGARKDPGAIVPLFVTNLGVAPGADVVSFYAARNGCVLLWLAKDDPSFDPVRHARDDRFPGIERVWDLQTDSMSTIAMPPIDDVFGARGIDYSRIGSDEPITSLARYERSFWGFDFPGDYYTPAFVVDHGRIAVQVGDDHGVFDDGRPTVSFDDYLNAVLATRGSIRWRAELFGFRASEPAFEEARRAPRRWLDSHRPSIDELLPAAPAALEAAEARARALPDDPRLRALVEAAENARATSYDTQPDGRTLMRIERADGARQLAFLRGGERETIERALEARRP